MLYTPALTPRVQWPIAAARPTTSTTNAHMRKPPLLRAGDVIGVVSPAAAVDESALRAGLELIEQAGFRVRLGTSALDRHGYLAGSDQNRVDDFHAMLRDPEVKAVIASRGGYGSGRLLPLLDPAELREHPKIVLGHSDMTFLLNDLVRRAGVVTFHGPMVANFARRPETAAAVLAFLAGDRTAWHQPGREIVQPGIGRGPAGRRQPLGPRGDPGDAVRARHARRHSVSRRRQREAVPGRPHAHATPTGRRARRGCRRRVRRHGRTVRPATTNASPCATSSPRPLRVRRIRWPSVWRAGTATAWLPCRSACARGWRGNGSRCSSRRSRTRVDAVMRRHEIPLRSRAARAVAVVP